MVIEDIPQSGDAFPLQKAAGDMTKLDHFYEGTEKLLEIWFTSSDGSNGKMADLRAIPREKYVELLAEVNANILSVTSSATMDAYVLSESSMFVSKRSFLLKTCGSTTLIKAIQPLLKLVNKYTSLSVVEDLFYSRKDFLCPELQDTMHQSFDREVKYLDTYFNGHAYCFGRLNDQCWYLYVLNSKKSCKMQEGDQCLEILMENLDPQVMSIFTRNVSSSAQEATRKSGIDLLIPGSIIDDFLFDPCGYSMNGLMSGGKYFTIHITPEPAFSYVSFETNIDPESYMPLIKRVLDVFRPGKFLMTIFSTKNSLSHGVHKEVDMEYEMNGFERMDFQQQSLRNYSLSYLSYVKDIT